MKIYPFFFSFLFSLSLFSQQKINDGNDVIRTMHKKYENGKWYKNLTFIQDIVFYKEGKEDKKEVWYEALSSPCNLTIKFDSINSRSGVVLSDYKISSIKNGKASEPKSFIHDLLLVGFDVYFLTPDQTIHLLDSLGYNLKIMREDIFDGRKVYVIGALKDDLQSNQFWIDTEHLYMVRIIYKKKEKIQEVLFGDYSLIENNRVAKKIVFKNNGQIEAIENYYNIRFPKTLSPDIFKTEKFSETRW